MTDHPPFAMVGSMAIGDRIREGRSIRGITQQELARLLGYTPGAIGLWETHVNRPSLKSVIALSSVLQLPLSFFVSDASEPAQITVSDPQELALIHLFRRMDQAQRDVHLQPFYSSAGLTKPPKA